MENTYLNPNEPPINHFLKQMTSKKIVSSKFNWGDDLPERLPNYLFRAISKENSYNQMDFTINLN